MHSVRYRMKANAVVSTSVEGFEDRPHQGSHTEETIPGRRFSPQRAGPPTPMDQHRQSLRMYTEEEVAEMLQVSLSQLRKWRTKRNQRKKQGPPFRKIGRLVRYPERGLLAFINGE